MLPSDQVSSLRQAVGALLRHVEKAETELYPTLESVRDTYLASAINLLHYLALRQHDIRAIQHDLGKLGLSRLGRAEAHVMASLLAVDNLLSHLDHTSSNGRTRIPLLEIEEGQKKIRQHTSSLLGEIPQDSGVHIMVTVPTDAASDSFWAEEMIMAGMTVARINCAHDNESIWKQMVQHLRAASKKLSRPLAICMDLAGPKLRTGKVKGEIRVRPGDSLILTRDPVPGRGEKRNKDDKLIRPAHVSCTLPVVFERVKKGDPIKINDGKIEGKVVSISEDQMQVHITYARPKGSPIRSDKGINFPKSDLGISGLTERDKKDLQFVSTHADILNFSFVNSAKDVRELHTHLRKIGKADLGVIFKIETLEGFRRLPEILLEGMKKSRVGVMVARGDLAVEVGWQDLALVQSEIIRICEAAHVPVVWATQVLENLAKKGRPSRAEITDLAMGSKVEGVMLNKGPHIREAIEMIQEVLGRVQDFQEKSSPLLPRLQTYPPGNIHLEVNPDN